MKEERGEREPGEVTDSSAVISARSGTRVSMAVVDIAFHTERSGCEIGIGDDTMAGRVHRLCVTHTR